MYNGGIVIIVFTTHEIVLMPVKSFQLSFQLDISFLVELFEFWFLKHIVLILISQQHEYSFIFIIKFNFSLHRFTKTLWPFGEKADQDLWHTLNAKCICNLILVLLPPFKPIVWNYPRHQKATKLNTSLK